eukprot:6194732-Pleurochrysis_carterae.AAC.1
MYMAYRTELRGCPNMNALHARTSAICVQVDLTSMPEPTERDCIWLRADQVRHLGIVRPDHELA